MYLKLIVNDAYILDLTNYIVKYLNYRHTKILTIWMITT